MVNKIGTIMKSFGQKISGAFAVFLISMIAFSFSASAITLSAVENVDMFIKACNLASSGDAAEIGCVESVSGLGTVTDIQKFTFEADPTDPDEEDLLLVLTEVTGGAPDNTYALELPPVWQSDYFIVKTGNLAGEGKQTYLFQNLSSFAYAVFNLDSSGGNIPYPFAIEELGKVSHISAFQLIPTPLPAAVWMFMAALGGIFGVRRIGLKRRA